MACKLRGSHCGNVLTEIKMESSKHCSFWGQLRNQFQTTGFAAYLLLCLAIFGEQVTVFLDQPLPSNNSGIIEPNINS